MVSVTVKTMTFDIEEESRLHAEEVAEKAQAKAKKEEEKKKKTAKK